MKRAILVFLQAGLLLIASNIANAQDKAHLIAARNIIHNYNVIYEALNKKEETKTKLEPELQTHMYLKLVQLNDVLNQTFGQLDATLRKILSRQGTVELKANWLSLVQTTAQLIETKQELAWKLYVVVTGMNKAQNKRDCAYLLCGGWVMDKNSIKNSTDVARNIWLYWAARVVWNMHKQENMPALVDYYTSCPVDKVELAKIVIAVMNADVARIEKIYDELITEKSGLRVPIKDTALMELVIDSIQQKK